jgi:hypothetical protein
VAAVRWIVEDALGLSMDTMPRSVTRQAILGEHLTMPAEAEAPRHESGGDRSRTAGAAPQLEELSRDEAGVTELA